MAGVTGRLLEQVEQDPAKGEVLSIAPRPHRQLVRTGSSTDDEAAPLARFSVASPELVRFDALCGTELPVGVRVPIDARPRLAGWKSAEADLHPGLLHERKVIEQSCERQPGRRVLQHELCPGQAVRLGQQRLTLVVEVLNQQAELRAVRIGV